MCVVIRAWRNKHFKFKITAKSEKRKRETAIIKHSHVRVWCLRARADLQPL